uniref:DNA polymerase n=1 Tax=Geladintestivirus 2 TaxID=3233134 RepID=A0AAU8MIP7_9CAUD
MIKSFAVDTEIFPNLFSATFVDLNDYLLMFKDCVDEKGKPKALTECLSVKEIKERLDKVKSDIFYISDTDDTQLIELVGYFNSMQSHYDTITTKDGNVTQIPVRTDLFGFNNQGYDDLMIKAFLMQFNRFDSTKELIHYLYNISKKIISLQSDKDAFYHDKELELIRNYRLPYKTIDLQQVYGLHSASVITDKDTGERQKFGKSLKQTSINLKWHELLDFTLPDIDEEEYEYYWSKLPNVKGLTIEEVNKLVTTDFDRYVLPKYIKPMLYYNKNDVFLCCEIIRQKPDEVKLRYSISHAFGVNVLCSARANVADKLTTKFYSDMSGLRREQFIKGRTERNRLSFNRIIFPHIKFKTKQLQDFLEEIKQVTIYHTNKGEFEREIDFYGTKYTIATGGIHSQDLPRICISDDKYVYIHHDYTSYYPSIMISYNIAPKHLNENAFIKMLSFLKDTRVKCKHTKDSDGYVMDGVPNKIGAEALKIVINSIYGKLGSELFFLYDRLAQMKVTINGQLMTMTLVEELELNGIHVISANTDGIVIKLPKDKFDIYKAITDKWNETNKMGADYEEYERIVSRDINNYFDIQTDGTIEYKGALDPKQYIKDLKKGYDSPIVAKAVFEYFVNNVPVMETLRKHTDILDFCKTQNVGRQFDVVYDIVENGNIKRIYSQRHVRFYVSTKGVIIQKEHKSTKQLSKLAGGNNVCILNSLDDKPIEERNINYSYYRAECYKIIDPIMLGVSPTAKGDRNKRKLSGKAIIKKYSEQYNVLFNNDDFEDNSNK